MNFLAHLYLSGSNKEILIGNFIADAIRGNKYQHYQQNIQLGIKLHREIDTFRDTHAIFRQSKYRLNPQYNLYRGVIIDIIYDHLLAKNWNLYSNIPLKNYCESIYHLLNSYYDILPEKTQYLLPYMTQQNWLYSYRTLHGIASILHDMNVRTKGRSKMNLAINDLKLHYNDFDNDFQLFFEELRTFTQNKIIEYGIQNH